MKNEAAQMGMIEDRARIDERAMGLALEEAAIAGSKGEVPVGAVLLGPGGELIARGHNTRETEYDPTGHAEIVVLRNGPRGLVAVQDRGLDGGGVGRGDGGGGSRGSGVGSVMAKPVDGWRLGGCTLYVTLEPCTMCAGAIVLARVSRLVFGAWDPKAGACGSIRDVVRDARLNHEVEVGGGLRAEESTEMLRSFFTARRPGRAPNTAKPE